MHDPIIYKNEGIFPKNNPNNIINDKSKGINPNNFDGESIYIALINNYNKNINNIPYPNMITH